MSTVRPPREPLLDASTMRFLATGVLNTLLTATVIFALKAGLQAGDVAANAIGYLCGLASSFALNSRWTFDYGGSQIVALRRFVLAFLLAYGLNLLLVLALIRTGVNPYLAHLAGMPAYTLAFYLLCRHYVFVGQRRPELMAPAATAPAVKTARRGFDPRLGWAVPTLAIATLLLFYKLGAAPVQLWDESRLANNALEMSRTGLSLVTTFDGVPDHWNTKPPLLIWLMMTSIDLFGPHEWSLRLPSALAALATVTMVYLFCAIHLSRPFAGFLAAMILLGARVYSGQHGARTGDYDVMLTALMTSSVICSLLYLHAPPERQRRWLWATALCLALAFLTKTVQGLIFVPGILLYALAAGRLPSLLRDRQWPAATMAAIGLGGGYYLLRERFDPGYIASALTNDFGRYAAVVDNPDLGPFFYVTALWQFYWLLPGLAIAAWLTFRGDDERTRRVAALFGLCALAYLVVISTARTKIYWYMMPVTPLLSVVSALGCTALLERVSRRWHGSLPALQCGVAVLGLAIVARTNIAHADYLVKDAAGKEADQYSFFLRSGLLEQHTRPGEAVVVVHPGFPAWGYLGHYVAPTKFYAARLHDRGYEVLIQPPTAALPTTPRHVVACSGTARRMQSEHPALRLVTASGPCSLYRWPGG